MSADTLEKDGLAGSGQGPGQTAIAEGDDPLADLRLTPDEAAEEAAERARTEGLDDEEVARQREEAFGRAQAALDAEGGSEPERRAGEPQEPEEGHVPPDQIVLRGKASGSPKFAGKQPGTTILSLKGVKFAVDGGFRKGERIRFSGEALVISEGAKDRLDKETLTAVESVQEHQAIVLDLELED